MNPINVFFFVFILHLHRKVSEPQTFHMTPFSCSVDASEIIDRLTGDSAMWITCNCAGPGSHYAPVGYFRIAEM